MVAVEVHRMHLAVAVLDVHHHDVTLADHVVDRSGAIIRARDAGMGGAADPR
jgi:phosphoribosylpyrophosphate synthetase